MFGLNNLGQATWKRHMGHLVNANSINKTETTLPSARF